MPDEQIVNSQLDYITVMERAGAHDLLDGLGGGPVNEFSLRKDKVAYAFMEEESKHLEFFGSKKKSEETKENENEFINLVVRWKMPRQKKQGFFVIFGVHMLKKKKQVTNNCNRMSKRVSKINEMDFDIALTYCNV